MSGIDPGPADEIVVLAGEYVLGTLPADEAARVLAEAAGDPALAAAITDWERRLTPLATLMAPIAPPAALWLRIEASVGASPQASPGEGASVTTLRPNQDRDAGLAKVGIWRGLAAAGFLLAATFAGIAVLSRQPPAGSQPTVVAALSPIGASPAAFVVEAGPDGALSVRPLRPEAVPSGRDLELWSLPAGAKAPRALGVLPAGGLRLAAGAVPAGAVQILVSLEPKGGSPTGLPTGPVLYGGALARAE